MRALLKIPLRLDGGFIGALIFFSKTPGRYSEEDVVVARRVADHVSLALSHQCLAEEQRQAAEARERAARLEQRVQAPGSPGHILKTDRESRARRPREGLLWFIALFHPGAYGQASKRVDAGDEVLYDA